MGVGGCSERREIVLSKQVPQRCLFHIYNVMWLTALEFQSQAILLTYSDLRQVPLLPGLQCLHLCTEESGTKCSAGTLGQLLALFEPQV